MREFFSHDSRFSIPAVDVLTREASVLAEIFETLLAEPASTVRRMQPRNSYAIPFLKSTRTHPHSVHDADNLMSGHHRQLGKRQISLYGVQVGVAQTTAAYSPTNFARSGHRKRYVLQIEGSLFD